MIPLTVEQAPDRAGVGVGVVGGESVDVGLGQFDGFLAGLDGLVEVEDGPVVGLDWGLGMLRHFGQHVAGYVDQAALP